MKLTDNAKADFNEWFVRYSNDFGTVITASSYGGEWLIDLDELFEELPEILQQRIIINWFETLEYMGENLFLSVFEKSFAIKASFMSFGDILDQAIEICNKVYNAQSKA